MFLFLLLLSFNCSIFANMMLSTKDAEDIGKRIWSNECKGTSVGLTTWNKGEEFASLGIGHFIWFPAHKKFPFQETFPEFLSFLEDRSISYPSWLKVSKKCPWNSKDEFDRDLNSSKMIELRSFLLNTIPLQTSFIFKRSERAFELIKQEALKASEPKVISRLEHFLNSSNGIYILVDYLNFKGNGMNPKERYQGEGWGLFQVLKEMRDPVADSTQISEFIEAAKIVLLRRVQNAPDSHKENRWLKGWYSRLETYRDPKEKR